MLYRTTQRAEEASWWQPVRRAPPSTVHMRCVLCANVCVCVYNFRPEPCTALKDHTYTQQREIFVVAKCKACNVERRYSQSAGTEGDCESDNGAAAPAALMATAARPTTSVLWEGELTLRWEFFFLLSLSTHVRHRACVYLCVLHGRRGWLARRGKKIRNLRAYTRVWWLEYFCAKSHVRRGAVSVASFTSVDMVMYIMCAHGLRFLCNVCSAYGYSGRRRSECAVWHVCVSFVAGVAPGTGARPGADTKHSLSTRRLRVDVCIFNVCARSELSRWS